MNKKIIGTILIVALLSAVLVTQVFAAPTAAVGEGTITAIVIETDFTTTTTTVVVTLEDAGLVHTVQLSLESALTEGLLILDRSLETTDVVIVDTDGLTEITHGLLNTLAFVTDPPPPPTMLTANITTPEDTTVEPSIPSVTADYLLTLQLGAINNLVIVDETMIGTTVAFEEAIIEDYTEFGKVLSKVGSFFGTALGVDYATLQGYQDDGFGYGEIVQASWMAYLLGGDAATLDQILAAKESGDFSGIVLPDGSTVTNWGQLRKAVLTDPKQNVGQIISGKADPLTTAETEPTEVPTESVTTSSQSVDEKTNNGNAATDKTNNGNAADEKTNNGGGNTKDKTNNGKKP